MIDNREAVFNSLRLWQDTNHNGISEPYELHTLPELRVKAISLDFRESRRRDRYDNSFRYRAKVYGVNNKDLGRWAYDVFLLSGDSPTAPRKQANTEPLGNMLRLIASQSAYNFLDPQWGRSIASH